MYKLPKKIILRKNSGFQMVYRAGKSYANRALVVYILPNEQNQRRVGFAAGKRLGKAVVRNRVKRLLKEAYRLNQEQISSGFDLIFIGRKPLIKAKLPDVVKALLDVCRRAKLLKKQA